MIRMSLQDGQHLQARRLSFPTSFVNSTLQGPLTEECVLANVVPVSLALSRKRLEIIAGESSRLTNSHRNIMIVNPSPSLKK